MFKRMVLKRVWDEVQRLENATKKRSIRISAKMTYWPFRDIAKLGEWCLTFNVKVMKLGVLFCAFGSWASQAAITAYSNVLNSQSSLDQDFYNLSPAGGSGSFGVNNGRLEFTTSQTYTGVLKYKQLIGFDQSFVVTVNAHLNGNLNYLVNSGDQLQIGVAVFKDINTLDTNELLKEYQTLKLKRDAKNGIINNHVTDAFYTSSNSTEKYWQSGDYGSFADVSLKTSYDSASKTLTSFWKLSSDSNYIQLNSEKLDNEWSLNSGTWMSLGIYGVSNLGTGSTGFDVLPGQMYLSDFSISVPEPSALSLLAVGLGGLAMMRRLRS